LASAFGASVGFTSSALGASVATGAAGTAVEAGAAQALKIKVAATAVKRKDFAWDFILKPFLT
jgi:hypothetical protein